MAHTQQQVRLEITDNGTNPPPSRPAVRRDATAGTGLKGLAERLAEAGGSLVTQAGPQGGFQVIAELPKPM